MILSIDPGASGCIAVQAPDFQYVAHLHMPTMKLASKTRVNGAAVAAFIRQHPITHAYLELVGAMPKQGGSSMFSFGHSAGVVEGLLQGLEIPYTLVRPEAWKKRAGLIGTEKDSARARAIQLWPGLRDLDLKEKGQALADALLIGRYGHA